MADPLKNMYSRDFITDTGKRLSKYYPGLDSTNFTKTVMDEGWENLELKQRVRRITETLNSSLTGNYENDIEILLRFSDSLISEGKEMTFNYIFLPDFIELYGLQNYRLSTDALAKVTQLASAEFAVRPFIVKYSEMIEKMIGWSKSKNLHQRRLASEGSRPRLPWGMALSQFKKDPSPVLPILENLKQDESLYVRRSVANNLNDISKDHPDMVLDLLKGWKGKNENTDWIIKHACRGLLKKGHQPALGLFELHTTQIIKPEITSSEPTVNIGDSLTLRFKGINADHSLNLRIEFAVDYVKKFNVSRKVFMVTERYFQAGEKIDFTRKLSFEDLTTRTHYPGEHKISLIINGEEKASLILNVTKN